MLLFFEMDKKGHFTWKTIQIDFALTIISFMFLVIWTKVSSSKLYSKKEYIFYFMLTTKKKYIEYNIVIKKLCADNVTSDDNIIMLVIMF